MHTGKERAVHVTATGLLAARVSASKCVSCFQVRYICVYRYIYISAAVWNARQHARPSVSGDYLWGRVVRLKLYSILLHI